MMAPIDIDRITEGKHKVERLINNAVRACKTLPKIGLRPFGMVYLLSCVKNITEKICITKIYINDY